MEISSRFVKISGAFELPIDLINGNDYQIVLNGGIVSRTEKPDEQGGVEIEYRFRPLTGDILQDNGQSVKMTDKTRKSVRLRTMITREFDFPYEQAMDSLMSDPEALRRFIENKL